MKAVAAKAITACSAGTPPRSRCEDRAGRVGLAPREVDAIRRSARGAGDAPRRSLRWLMSDTLFMDGATKYSAAPPTLISKTTLCSTSSRCVREAPPSAVRPGSTVSRKRSPGRCALVDLLAGGGVASFELREIVGGVLFEQFDLLQDRLGIAANPPMSSDRSAAR